MHKVGFWCCMNFRNVQNKVNCHNKIIINESKTKVIVFRRPNPKKLHMFPAVDGTELVVNVKWLGLILQNNLCWNACCIHLSSMQPDNIVAKPSGGQRNFDHAHRQRGYLSSAYLHCCNVWTDPDINANFCIGCENNFSINISYRKCHVTFASFMTWTEMLKSERQQALPRLSCVLVTISELYVQHFELRFAYGRL